MSFEYIGYNKSNKMKIILNSTTKVVQLGCVSARIWEGETETGIKVHAYITRIAYDINEPPEVVKQFTSELEQCRVPSPAIEAIPLRLII